MHKIATRLQEIIQTKQTRLCLAADLTNARDILDLIDATAEHICLLKTHIDIIEDFSWDFIDKLKARAKEHNFLIFEDRKFADIGNTVKLQAAKGMYRIFDWADIVNAHILPGEGIIDGLKQAAEGKSAGLVLIAQMSSEGNLATPEYTAKNIELAKRHKDFVVGFIGSGLHKAGIKQLRKLAGDAYMIFTPGIKFKDEHDALGQAYAAPAEAVQAGADVIIVGRGIYEAQNPRRAAKLYRRAAII